MAVSTITPEILKKISATCAELLNKDKFNAADAQRMYGHPLCTLDPQFIDQAEVRA